jgi:hypothetical protein
VQKILPQRFDRSDPNLAQGGIDLGKLHRKEGLEGERSANRALLFTKKV